MITRLFLTFALAVILTACFPEDNHGFPKKVYFSRDGGTCELISNTNIDVLSISLAHTHVDRDIVLAPILYKDDQRDSLIGTKEWLTAKFKFGENKITLVADTNHIGKKREMVIEYSFGDSWGCTQVIQK